MTSGMANNFHGMTLEQKCGVLLEALEDSLKKQEELAERTEFLEKVVNGTYPSPQELKRFLETPHTAWGRLLAKNDNWHNLNFLEWIYFRSKNNWQNEKFPTARQVNYALRLLDEYERKERSNIFNFKALLFKIRRLFKKN